MVDALAREAVVGRTARASGRAAVTEALAARWFGVGMSTARERKKCVYTWFYIEALRFDDVVVV